MITIECDTCPAPRTLCADCLVTAMGGGPLLAIGPARDGAGVPEAESRAIAVLQAAGLISGEPALAALASAS